MVGRLLYLEPGEVRRLLPFFGLYFLLFAGLTVADGLATSLFVQRMGSAALPAWYGLAAVLGLAAIGAYVTFGLKLGNRQVFQWIVGGSAAVFLLAWIALALFDGGESWCGLLFIGRETAATLVLMHFGTFLQDYFTRAELNRVMTVVYAGGRLGGIAGGWLLTALAAPLGLANLALLFVGVNVAAMLAIAAIAARIAAVHSPADDQHDADVAGADVAGAEETAALATVGGFLRFAWRSPLLFWTTATTLLFIVCRWILNYQYSAYFESRFADEVAMAQFLGRYTQAALLCSLLLQLLLVNRLVQWIGLKATNGIYGGLLASTLLLNLFPMTLLHAIGSRFLECELRFGLRNPTAQMFTNKFSKAMRIRVRAWSLGFLIPCATLATSALLTLLIRTQSASLLAATGGAAGVGHLLACFGLYRSCRDPRRPAIEANGDAQGEASVEAKEEPSPSPPPPAYDRANVASPTWRRSA